MTRKLAIELRAALVCLIALLSAPVASVADDKAAAPSAAWNADVSKAAKAKPAAAAAGSAKTGTAGTAAPGKPAEAAKPAGASTTPPAATKADAAPAATPLVAAPAAAAASPAGSPIVTGAIPPPAAPQAVKTGDWMLQCSAAVPAPSCMLRQVIGDSKNRRIIEFRAQSVRNTAFLEIIVPVGISIPYGVTVDVAEGKKLPAQLVDCVQNGCRAVLPLSTENLAALKAAQTLAVTFQDSKSGKVISISGSPKGFDLGIGKVIGSG